MVCYKMEMKLSVFLIIISFAAKENKNVAESVGNYKEKVNETEAEGGIFVKIEEDEYAKIKKTTSSQYVGVSYDVNRLKWCVLRYSRHEKKMIYNGSYDNEETAAHASDTLARKLMANGEQNHKLSFPDDEIEVYPEEKTTSSQYIGVSYDVNKSKWSAQRHNKHKKRNVFNGSYDNEETAAQASDTLARTFMANGEQNHKLNFPDDDTEVYPEEKITSSQYIGVSYDVNKSKWRARRHSKHEKRDVYNGSYESEETAAHASDTLARNLMANGKQNQKLNFPDDDSEVYPERQRKRKRPDHEDLGHPKNN